MKLKLSGADGRISGLEAQLTRTENQKHEVEFKLTSLHSALRRTLGIRGVPLERARYSRMLYYFFMISSLVFCCVIEINGKPFSNERFVFLKFSIAQHLNEEIFYFCSCNLKIFFNFQRERKESFNVLFLHIYCIILLKDVIFS